MDANDEATERHFRGAKGDKEDFEAKPHEHVITGPGVPRESPLADSIRESYREFQARKGGVL